MLMPSCKFNVWLNKLRWSCWAYNDNDNDGQENEKMETNQKTEKVAEGTKAKRKNNAVWKADKSKYPDWFRCRLIRSAVEEIASGRKGYNEFFPWFVKKLETDDVEKIEKVSPGALKTFFFQNSRKKREGQKRFPIGVVCQGSGRIPQVRCEQFEFKTVRNR